MPGLPHMQAHDAIPNDDLLDLAVSKSVPCTSLPGEASLEHDSMRTVTLSFGILTSYSRRLQTLGLANLGRRTQQRLQYFCATHPREASLLIGLFMYFRARQS